uniref:zinc ribbon domain-containing protein n=1 Tax=Candidatus Nitrososphaera gargensis TaxID=497727 RepID=UPI002252CADC|nr:zinc ribbon domain-containing protein [Candidatus Nitrososphaera gargensis]
MEVEPAYSSVDCSRRGHPVPKSIAVRTHASCQKCRAVLDRDYNAATNILKRGRESLMMLLLLLLPVERREVTRL